MRRLIILAGMVAALFAFERASAQQGTGPVPASGAGNYGPVVQNSGGHVAFGGGAAPSINAACGTGAVAPLGSDSSFQFTSGTGTSNSCTITPAVAWSKRPTCSIDGEAGAAAYSTGPSGVIALTGVADGVRYNVICIGQPGGL